MKAGEKADVLTRLRAQSKKVAGVVREVEGAFENPGELRVKELAQLLEEAKHLEKVIEDGLRAHFKFDGVGDTEN